ncbi:MAG: tyrosine-type recombinase/integrase [Vicingaceae bacterium]
MKSFKDYLQSQGKSKSTVSHYSSYALDFLAWLDKDHTKPENATAKEVLSYLNHLQKKGQESKTRNIRLNVIKQFFNFQIDCGHRTDNPVQHLKLRGAKTKKLYPILDKQQLDKLYTDYKIPNEKDERAKRNWFKSYRLSKARNKAILSLMIHQGLTTPEVNNLQLNDLKLKEGKIFIAGGRKSNERLLELKSNQIIELMEYQFTSRKELLKYCKGETKSLFISSPPFGRNYNVRTDCKEIWKRLSQEIKEQNKEFINFKQVRTSVITHWLKQFNLRQVQYMAGHRYVSSTEGYLVNHTEDLQKDIDEFYPF